VTVPRGGVVCPLADDACAPVPLVAVSPKEAPRFLASRDRRERVLICGMIGSGCRWMVARHEAGRHLPGREPDAGQQVVVKSRETNGCAEGIAGFMVDGHESGIEQAFARTEADAEAALKAAAQVVSGLRRLRGAAHQGKMRELQTAAGAIRESIQALDQAVANAAESWEFDEEGYLQAVEFSQELIARALAAGVRISELDGRLYCYPALIRVLPGERALLIDKTRERRLRPSVLVEVLRDVQRRPPRFRSGDFLEALHAAYQVAIPRKSGRTYGAVVPLGELYELLTMLPGQAREYARQEFARDVYLLDQSGQTRTKEGAAIEFHIGAGARVPRGALSIVTQQGVEKKYHGISFTAPAEA